VPVKILFPIVANMNNGIPTPLTYARVTRIRAMLTDCVANSVAIVASIGPAHGDHTIPRENPVINPPLNPLVLFPLFV
jgi:hypothetical protein